MAVDTEPITLDRAADYARRLNESQTDASDYSFVNLWGWAPEYDLRWHWDSELVWIHQAAPEPLLWAPVGPWDTPDWPAVFSRCFPEGAEFIRIPKRLADIWQAAAGDRVEIREARDHWDYLYDVTELVELKGNRFHKKKNLLNQFRKKYDYRYSPMDARTIEMALAMQEDWCSWRDCESSETLSAENRAIGRVLENWDDLDGLEGGALLIDDHLIAYTVGENLTDDTLVIHFEKGCQGYKGVYQAINQMFLESAGSPFRYVNREQDLGDEGLRKAKESYNPVGYVEKYRVTVLPS